MQELAVTRKGLEDLQVARAGDAQRVWSFLGQADAVLASFGFSPVRTGGTAPKGGVVVPSLILPRQRYPIWRMLSAAASRRKAVLWPKRWPSTC
jgi:hypothetical protein